MKIVKKFGQKDGQYHLTHTMVSGPCQESRHATPRFDRQRPSGQCALTPIVFVARNTNTVFIEIGGAMTADTPPEHITEAA